MANEVLEQATALLARLEETQGENVRRAADLVADTIEQGGILQAFGAGHSHAGALELCSRAGGLVPAKLIREPAFGNYETVEGVGALFMKQVRIDPGDTVFIISNSGRNPLPIEIAMEASRRGAKVVGVTALEVSRGLKSRHSSGKRLFELSDAVIDNGVPEGDACILLDGMDTKICGMSSIVVAAALQWVVCETVKTLLNRGITPPVFKSQNLDGGTEFNDRLLGEYVDRIYHI